MPKVRSETDAVKAISVDSLADLIRGKVSELVGVDAHAIANSDQFAKIGLDSVRATWLASVLSEVLARSVSPVDVFANPTARDLAERLVNGTSTRRSGPAGAGHDTNEPIAIVGVACRFPGAPDVASFWEMLSAGTDAVRDVPPERWDATRLTHPDPATPGRMVTSAAGYLDSPVDGFDPLFFGISPREADEMDPQQRLFLEVAWEAIEASGTAPTALSGSRTGVFAGVIWHDYADLGAGRATGLTSHSATGRALNMVANRVSYLLGLRGPSVAVDSACSSSLLAVHLACQSLRSGECTVAIAGGTNLLLSPETVIALTKFGGLSADGRCKAFAAAADGFGRGEGCGVIVLKPLSRALADGDDIWCTIRGSATNNDGFSNGLTAPNPLAQEDVLRDAYNRAAVDPSAVHFVETHGTGTMLGDPIEASALGAVLGVGRENPVVIGSVKTNIGHLEGAAGIAGIIKTALCLRHRQIPANLHFDEPNPHIDFDALNLRVPRAIADWPQERALLAGVSSFGWGGTNVHVVLAGHAEPPALDIPMPMSADTVPAERPKIAFVCSPHGHQWAGMARLMYRSEPAFRAVLSEIDELLRPHTGWSIVGRLFADDSAVGDDDVSVTQPILFAVQVAIASWLRAYGVQPDAVTGHSLGEITAAVIAGILDLPDAVLLVHHYSRLQQVVADQDDGGMAVIELPAAELADLVADSRVVVAGYNGPSATVLSGPIDDLQAMLAELKSRDVLCSMIRVNLAAHSPAIDPIMGELERELAGIRPHPGEMPMISTLTGEPVDWRAVDGRYFVRNLREPVQLADATAQLLGTGHRVLVEISANPVLRPALQQSIEAAGGGTVLTTMRRGDDDRIGLVDLLADLDALGARSGEASPPARTGELITLSAGTPEALCELAGLLADTLDGADAIAMPDLADAVNRRAEHDHRLATVATSGTELAGRLREFAGGCPVADIHTGSVGTTRPRVALVFPGQGSQWTGMGRELLHTEPVFHAAIRECDEAAREFVDWSILEQLGDDAAAFDRIDVVQPLLFAMQVALAKLWRSWGVEPAAVVGHSMGEVAAAHIAGAVDLTDAMRVICLRSKLMRRASGQGAMLAVELTMDEAREAIDKHRDVVSIAVSNSPRSTVLSGQPQALEHVAEALSAKEVFCRWVKVDVASHSPQMDALRDDLLDELRDVRSRPVHTPIYSTVTGEVSDGTGLDAAYWVANLREPVLFGQQAARLIEDGVRLFVEMSPHPILLPAAKQVAMHDGRQIETFPSLRRSEPEHETMLHSLGGLYVQGVEVDRSRAATPGRRGVKLPGYPWQRERYWSASFQAEQTAGSVTDGVLGSRLDSAIEPGTHFWSADVDVETASVYDHVIGGAAVLPGAACVGLIQAAVADLPDSGEQRPAIGDVEFLAPVVVEQASSRRLQIVCAGDTVRLFAQRSGAVEFDLAAQARLMVSDAKRPMVDLADDGDQVDGDRYYGALAAGGLEYGPAYQAVQRIQRTEDTAVAQLRLPDCAAADEFGAQTVLLDAALHTAIAPLLGPDWSTGGGGFVSAGIRSIAVHRPPTGDCVARAVVRTNADDPTMAEADIRLSDQDGEPFIDAIGVTILRLDAPPVLTALTCAPGLDERDGSRSTEPIATSDRDLLLTVPVGAGRRAALARMVADSVGQVIKLPAARIGLDQPLRGLGLDSIMSLELRNRLEARFQVRLSATAIWNYPTVRELSGFLADRMDLPLDTELAEPELPKPLIERPSDPIDDDALERELAELADWLEAT